VTPPPTTTTTTPLDTTRNDRSTPPGTTARNHPERPLEIIGMQEATRQPTIMRENASTMKDT
jgi:hypothetical protein